MDDETPTESPVEATGEKPLVAEVETNSAETATDETQPDQVDAVDAPADTDEDLDWAKKAGIDPTDPEALKKLAKIARDNQKTARTAQQAKSLQRELPEEENSYDPNVASLTRQVTELKFYQDNPDAKGREADLIAISKDYPELGQSFNLQALWEIAKGRQADKTVEAAKKEGREAAKAEIAKASTASTLKGNASSSTETKDNFADLSITEMEAKLGFIRR